MSEPNIRKVEKNSRFYQRYCNTTPVPIVEIVMDPVSEAEVLETVMNKAKFLEDIVE